MRGNIMKKKLKFLKTVPGLYAKDSVNDVRAAIADKYIKMGLAIPVDVSVSDEGPARVINKNTRIKKVI